MAKRVLVVDDEPSIRQLFELVLGEAGYEVVTAGDGATALERARAQPVDAVFLDILLPDAHGSEVFAKLKELTPPPVVCVLTAMTATDYDRLDDYVKLIRLGAEDLLLRKPLYKEDILKVTRKLLGDPARA